MSQRITITLPEEMVKEIQKEAEKRLTSVSAIIRERLNK